jgi:hypothetical protein
VACRGLDQFLLRAGTSSGVVLQSCDALLERLHGRHTCWCGEIDRFANLPSTSF